VEVDLQFFNFTGWKCVISVTPKALSLLREIAPAKERRAWVDPTARELEREKVRSRWKIEPRFSGIQFTAESL
jgi:hypothetical protein